METDHPVLFRLCWLIVVVPYGSPPFAHSSFSAQGGLTLAL